VNREYEFFANSSINRLDVNFVADLVFDKIGEFPIYIGPYPQNETDIEILKMNGISAVLNVQTDIDQVHRQVDWSSHLRAYEKNQIQIERYPIRDFDQEDLMKKLRGASDLLHKLISNNKTVYVHCTAGMSRAAATVILYIALYHNKNFVGIEETYDFVKSHRKIICPNMKVLERVFELSSKSREDDQI
jgi:protein-tyrosine phosphatase